MKNKAKFTIVLLFLISFNALNSQNEGFTGNYLASYPKTAFAASEQPLEWKSPSWIKAGSIIIIGSGLYFLDEDINKTIKRNRCDFSRQITKAGNLAGNGWYTIPIIGASCLGGYVFESPKTMDTALLSIKSLLIANGVSTVLKYGTQRYRPNRDKGNKFWQGKGYSHHRDSFPSGHATIVWSIAPVLAEQYKDTGWVPPLAYSIACVTGYARMHDEKHWASDVFTGAVIGYYTAQLVLQSTPRLTVSPSVEPTGIQLGWQFD